MVSLQLLKYASATCLKYRQYYQRVFIAVVIMHFCDFAETPNIDKRAYILYQKAEIDNSAQESTMKKMHFFLVGLNLGVCR